MRSDLATRATNFAAGFGVGTSLTLAVEVVNDAKVENVSANRVCEHRRVKFNELVRRIDIFSGAN